MAKFFPLALFHWALSPQRVYGFTPTHPVSLLHLPPEAIIRVLGFLTQAYTALLSTQCSHIAAPLPLILSFSLFLLIIFLIPFNTLVFFWYEKHLEI